MALNRQRQRGRNLTASQVKQYVGSVLKGQGFLTYSGHAKERMRKREFTTQDVQYVRETGSYSEGYWEAQEQDHEFNVAGFDLNGEELELSFALYINGPSLKLVTGKRAP
jgi:Domain of unknown function (DUF4258)